MRWLSVDLLTGSVINEIPQLLIDQALKIVISKASPASAKLPIVGAPRNWMRATQPYASALVALDDSDPDLQYQPPMWGGIVQSRVRDTGPTVVLGLATAEAYLLRRFIRDRLQYPAADYGVCEVGAALLGRYVVDGTSVMPGLPLRVVLLDPGVGKDVDLQDSDDKSVGSEFADLGFEYTVTWEWQPGDEPLLTPVLTMGTRIGTPRMPGLDPTVTFDYPGNLQSASLNEDYSDGKGANDVMATSTGSGSVRPQSAHQVAADFQGRPTVEYRYSAGTSITSRATLNTDAQETRAVMQSGAQALSLVALYGRAPRFGSKWFLGDDIGYDIRGPQFPDHPNGVARAIGVQFRDKDYTPILAGEDDL